MIITTKKSRLELNQIYGKRIVDQSLSVWSALNKAVEKDRIILDMVMSAKTTQKNCESLAMIIDESASEYLTRVKGQASAVKYCGVEVIDGMSRNPDRTFTRSAFST